MRLELNFKYINMIQETWQLCRLRSNQCATTTTEEGDPSPSHEHFTSKPQGGVIPDEHQSWCVGSENNAQTPHQRFEHQN